ncbi:MAG: soluble lytic murein transglycosylase [Candidatus Binatota bacterium]|nr:soluble lytic murein transglycosylase [Candidatus Binatota bacterium]
MRRLVASLLVLAACSTKPVSGPSTAVETTAARAEEDGASEQVSLAERRRRFREAVARYDRGDVDGAERLFLESARTYPELGDHSLRHLAKIAERRGDTNAARVAWHALLERHPDSVWRSEAALAVAAEKIEKRDLAEAERWVDEVREGSTDPSILASALWLASRIDRATGREVAARDLERELRSRYAGAPEAAMAREQAGRERELTLVTVNDVTAEGQLLLAEARPSEALDLVRRAAPRFADSNAFPDLLLLEAAALRATGDHAGALTLLEDLERRHPRHPAAARALFRRASLAWNRDQDAEASRLFTTYLRRYAQGTDAAESLYAVARIHDVEHRPLQAAERYEELARRYPKSSLAAEAAWRAGWSRYVAGRYTDAARTFARVAASSSKEAASALYWRGRALKKAGHDPAAVYRDLLDRFADGYYAMLAEARLDDPPGAALAGKVAPPRAASGATPVPRSDPHLARFDELREMHLYPLGGLELAAYGKKSGGSPPDTFLLEAWTSIEGYPQAFRLAAAADGCELDGPFVSYCYPLGYWTAVRRFTAAQRLDPVLVLALIRQESLFDASARSTADARGLMQLLPTTAARVAGPGIATADLYLPEPNLELGTRYLKSLLDRYGGNSPRALAAYNAGEAAVDKWLRRHPNVEDDEFVESISYRETRGYVKRVLRNRRIYSVLYGATVSADVNVLPVDVRAERDPQRRHEEQPDHQGFAGGEPERDVLRPNPQAGDAAGQDQGPAEVAKLSDGEIPPRQIPRADDQQPERLDVGGRTADPEQEREEDADEEQRAP